MVHYILPNVCGHLVRIVRRDETKFENVQTRLKIWEVGLIFHICKVVRRDYHPIFLLIWQSDDVYIYIDMFNPKWP